VQFLHQMFNVSALLLDDALKPTTLLTNGSTFFGHPALDDMSTASYAPRRQDAVTHCPGRGHVPSLFHSNPWSKFYLLELVLYLAVSNCL